MRPLRVFASFVVLYSFSLYAQEKTSLTKPIRLEEASVTKLPSTFRAAPPYHCDLDGRLYVRAHAGKGRDAIARLKADGNPELSFSTSSLNDEGATYPVFYDYAPDPNGGLFLIALKVPNQAAHQEQPPMARSNIVVRFDGNAEFRGIIPVRGFTPTRIAAFSNGYLLVAGPRGNAFGGGSSSAHWFTGIFQDDGTLIKRVDFSPDKLSSDKSDGAKQENGGSAQELTSKEATERDTINGQLEFISAPDGFVYATLLSNVDGPLFGPATVVARIAPSGEVRYLKIPGPEREDLFFLVVDGAQLFAGFGKGDDQFTEIRQFGLNGPQGNVYLLRRFQILGAPECARDNQVLVLRPDEKGGAYLVAYDIK